MSWPLLRGHAFSEPLVGGPSPRTRPRAAGVCSRKGYAFLVGPLERGVGFARAVSEALAEANLSKHGREIDERARCNEPGACHQPPAAPIVVELHQAEGAPRCLVGAFARNHDRQDGTEGAGHEQEQPCQADIAAGLVRGDETVVEGLSLGSVGTAAFCSKVLVYWPSSLTSVAVQQFSTS